MLLTEGEEKINFCGAFKMEVFSYFSIFVQLYKKIMLVSH